MSKLGDEPAFPRDFNAVAYTAGDGPLELTIPDPGPPGMSKRELFAAMAMQGLCANSGFNRETIEEESIDCANALLAELAKEPDDAEPT